VVVLAALVAQRFLLWAEAWVVDRAVVDFPRCLQWPVVEECQAAFQAVECLVVEQCPRCPQAVGCPAVYPEAGYPRCPVVECQACPVVVVFPAEAFPQCQVEESRLCQVVVPLPQAASLDNLSRLTQSTRTPAVGSL